MKLRRSLLVTAAPVAIGLACAGTALAATPRVSFRVEGASKTLLAPRTVTAPSSGSITKGGAPAGSCPADSAAGALNVATRGDWDGTYSSSGGLGIYVTGILGTTASYSAGSYWELFVNDRAASTGICDTSLKTGEQLLFAQVPAKGKAELPLVVAAPRTATVGQPFDVRTFVYPGRGGARRGVSGAHYATRGGGKVTVAAPMTSVSGTRRLSASKPGTITLTVSAPGEIRSAPVTIRVTR